jgi:hypothetical protein
MHKEFKMNNHLYEQYLSGAISEDDLINEDAIKNLLRKIKGIFKGTRKKEKELSKLRSQASLHKDIKKEIEVMYKMYKKFPYIEAELKKLSKKDLTDIEYRNELEELFSDIQDDKYFESWERLKKAIKSKVSDADKKKIKDLDIENLVADIRTDLLTMRYKK